MPDEDTPYELAARALERLEIPITPQFMELQMRRIAALPAAGTGAAGIRRAAGTIGRFLRPTRGLAQWFVKERALPDPGDLEARLQLAFELQDLWTMNRIHVPRDMRAMVEEDVDRVLSAVAVQVVKRQPDAGE